MPKLFPHKSILLFLLFSCFSIANAGATENTVDYRLPKTYQVTYQHINLKLNPDEDGYSGSTTLNITVHKPIDKLGLHWIDLDIKRMDLVKADKVRALTFEAGEYKMKWLSDGNKIEPGEYTLKAEFAGKYSTDALGLYKVNYQGNNYLFTQFENSLARRVFPLVDEPDTKIPYQLTLSVPKNLKVASNTPALTEDVNENWKTVKYAKTPPMPSYLIALTVGDLDVTPIEGLSVPGVIYSPKGSGSETGFAIRHTAEILTTLENYFGIKYPYKKLDFVAVPDFAFGAMENVGLVTYRSELLLRGDNASAGEATSTLNVIAHELAHMWYGNLVTMEWWNDLWLNEAFASWMARKVVVELYPQYQSNLFLPQAGAFGEDSLASTKPITREIKTEEDSQDGLGLNYSKGHAILNMLEQSIGDEKFQKAIQSYMNKHKWGNTKAIDLWTAVSKEASYDVVSAANSFLDQAGFPIISFDDKGTVKQQRFSNYGVEIAAQNWNVPVSVKYKSGEEIKEALLLLSEPSQKTQLLVEADWFLPIANGNGYYTWQIPKAKYKALLSNINELNDREKIALLNNSSFMLNAGKITIREHLDLLTQMTKVDNPLVFLDSMEEIKLIGESFVQSDMTPAFSNYVTKMLSPWFDKVGSTTKEDDDEDFLRLRPRLLRTLGQFGSNQQLNKELSELALQYLKEPKSVDSNLGREALRMAAMNDSSLVDFYFDAYENTSDASLKSNIMGSIYFTDEKAIERTFERVLSDKIPAGDSTGPIGGLFYVNKDHYFLYKVVAKNFDAILAKIPAIYQGYMPYITGPNCSEETLRIHKEFYQDKDPKMAIALQKSQEAQMSCISTLNREKEALAAFLKNYEI